MGEKSFNLTNPFSSLDLYEEGYGNEKIREIEMRYSYENDMIRAVSQGNHKALNRVISAKAFKKGIEKRVEDPVRNTKNYLIILNTLMRKGAEIGNVHPYYIHSMSSDFALKIEACKSVEEAEQLLDEMTYLYCKLVKTYSSKGYSPLVQNIVLLVDADLGAELTLSKMAEIFNVNASYLSSLFKKDTGETLTEFVNRKRIERAKYLLETTALQVQSISHSCGILDVNYFTKIFKKYTGVTPKDYRKTVNNLVGESP